MWRKNKILLIHLHCLFLLLPLVYSQQSKTSFHRLSLEEGLSQSIVNAIAQDHKGFIWFGTEDGLNRFDGYNFTHFKNIPDDTNSVSYNQITALICDNDGILWVGAFNGGLNRYDPVNMKFHHYRSDQKNPDAISHDIIWSIFKDRAGHIWIGTENGLNRMILDQRGPHYYTFKKIILKYPSKYSHSNMQVRAIGEDENGNLWIGTNFGLYLLRTSVEGIDDANPIHIKINSNNRNGNNFASIRSIYLDHQNTLWVGTDNGLFKLSDGSGQSTFAFKKYENIISDDKSLSNNQVFAIYEDRYKNLWIGTGGGGLNKMNRNSGAFQHFRYDPLDPSSISYDQIRSIFEDRSGVLWIGTYGGGVCKKDNSKKAFMSVSPDPIVENSLNQEIVWSIYEDKDDILWIGTHGGGLNRYDRKKNEFTYYLYDPNNENSISNNIVRLVLEDSKGFLWIGTHGGGLCRFDRNSGKFITYLHDPVNPNSLSHNEIRGLYEDSDGFLWVGTRGGGLNRLNLNKPIGRNPKFTHFHHNTENKNSISIDYIRMIIEDSKGFIWIGTLGGGLNKFNKNTRSFTRYRAQSGKNGYLSNDYIFSLYEDKSGIIWLGTWGGGLNRFDPDKETFKHYTVKDGLPNDAIYGILEDNENRLWMSTNKGISCFDPKTEKFRNYTTADGLLSNEFNGGSFFKSHTGEMFFGNIKGFNSFYPDQIIDNSYVPTIVITNFQKFYQDVKFDHPVWEIDEIELSHEDYVFSISFSALEYTYPENNQYAYRMLGLDDKWIFTESKKRFAGYTTLPPGKYHFQVKGSNNDGIWNNEGASIEIHITPPFWRTWWFALSLILMISALAVLAYRRRLKNIQLSAELQVAHDAQMSIMPQNDPQIKGYDISGICVPAYDVGGDFFDYIWLEEDQKKLGILIGDVSGKAMSAAMTAVLSSGMFNSLAREGHDVAKIMTHISNGLYHKTDKKSFIATLFLSLDLEKGEIIFTNAGLNEPIMKSTNSISYLKSNGPVFPLGIMDHVDYEEKLLNMKEGEAILVFTDGIVEAQNKDRELFGDDRLMELVRTLDARTLSASELKYKIIEEILNFSGSAAQFDDMTLIVIKKE